MKLNERYIQLTYKHYHSEICLKHQSSKKFDLTFNAIVNIKIHT